MVSVEESTLVFVISSNTMSEFMKQKKWVLLPFLFLLFYIYSLSISPYGVDHGYYVSVSKCLSEGMIPWKDFQLIYTPLGMYFMAIPYMVGGLGLSSAWAQAVFFLFIVGTAVLVYYILSEFDLKNSTKWLSVLFYLMLYYSSDTLSVELEPFAVFWCLLGVLFLLKFNKQEKGTLYLYGAGLCATLSFLSKQYGVIILLVYICMLLLGKRKRIMNIGILCSSSLISVLVYYVWMGWIINDFSFYQDLMGNDYPSRWQTFFSWGVKFFFLKSCVFIVILPVVYSKLSSVKKRMVLISIVGILLFSLQFYVRQYSHYCLFMYPFVVFIFAFVWDSITYKLSYLFPIGNICCVLILCYLDYARTEQGQIKLIQQSLYKEISKQLPAPTKTIVGIKECLQGPQIFSEVENVKPVNYLCNKFGFDSTEYPERVLKLFPDAECMIVDDDYLSWVYQLDSIQVSKQLQRMSLVTTIYPYKIKIYKTVRK